MHGREVLEPQQDTRRQSEEPRNDQRGTTCARIIDVPELEKVMFEAADSEIVAWYLKQYGPKVNLFVDQSQMVQFGVPAKRTLGSQEPVGTRADLSKRASRSRVQKGAILMTVPTIAMYADLACPYAYVSAYRLRSLRKEIRTSVSVAHKSLALEYVNREPTPKALLEAELPILVREEPGIPSGNLPTASY